LSRDRNSDFDPEVSERAKTDTPGVVDLGGGSRPNMRCLCVCFEQRGPKSKTLSVFERRKARAHVGWAYELLREIQSRQNMKLLIEAFE
jgi:hypothetical protein